MRRCPTLMIVLAMGAVITISSRTNSAQAATISYVLKAESALPVPASDISEPQIVATVSGAGAIVPTTLADGSQGSPLTILSDSKGFDPGQLVVALKDETNAAGEKEQQFGLVFYGSGLAADGYLHFSLNVNDVLAADPSLLKLSSPPAGFTLVSDQIAQNNPPGTGGVPTDTPQNVPEPFSIVVWSAIAGVGLLRVRSTRRKATRLGIANR